MFLRSARRLAPVILGALYLGGCSKAPDTGTTSSASAATVVYKMEASIINPPDPTCVHLDMPYSSWLCPDSLHVFRTMDVSAETLVVHTSTPPGGVIRIALPPRTDAIFLSESALETFLLRHYDATDTAKARLLREYMRRH